MQYRTHMLKNSKPSWLFQVQFLSIVTLYLCAGFPISSLSCLRLLLHHMCEKSKSTTFLYYRSQTDISEHQSFRRLWSYFIPGKFILFSSIHSANPSLFKDLVADFLEVSSSFWSSALPKQRSLFAFQPDHSSFTVIFPFWDFHFCFWHLPNNSFNIHAILVNHCRSVLVVTLIQTFISMLSTVYQISLLCDLTEIPQNTEQLIFSFCFDLTLHTTYCTRKKGTLWCIHLENLHLTVQFHKQFLFISSFKMQKSRTDPRLWSKSFLALS